jgi:phosphoglycerol transferase MdoB-like AlkP superfamily enzyme
MQTKSLISRLFNRGRTIEVHLGAYILLYLFFLLALYSVSRGLFYWYNSALFPQSTWKNMARIMVGGLRFDISAIVYTNMLFFLMLLLPFRFKFSHRYYKVLSVVFVTTNAIALAANTADIFYYKFTLRRTTIAVFSQFKNEQNGIQLLWAFFVDYWPGFLLWGAMIGLLVLITRKLRYRPSAIKKPWLFYVAHFVGMAAGVGLMVAGARGGFRYSTRPITLSNAAAYVNDYKEVNIVLNTPFSFIRTISTTQIKKVSYFPNEDSLAAIFNPVKQPATDTGAMRKYNVVVFILESFSKEFVGKYNQHFQPGYYQGYTPFLDSLIGVSRAYQYSFANGRSSIDAMPSALASIPSLSVNFISSHYSTNKINSLASLLRKEGYHTAFFHGAPNGSMGFDAFANQSKFEQYFGKTEYNNDDDFDGIWGIWDDKFFAYFADQLRTFKQPFLASLFSVSSHHPYKLPEQFAKQFNLSDKPIHNTIAYTDYSLRLFFEKVKHEPWFKNTIFVFTADHVSAETKYPQYHSITGAFSIPIFFYSPLFDSTFFDREQVIQQTDIMPTVLGFLGYKHPYVSFGRDIWKGNEKPFAFNYLNNHYQLFDNDYLLLFDGEKSNALYRYKTDTLCANNIIGQHKDIANAMEKRIKALIQQYNNRVIEDRMTVTHER